MLHIWSDKKHRHFFCKDTDYKIYLKKHASNLRTVLDMLLSSSIYTMENNIVLVWEIFYIQKMLHSYEKNGSDTYLHGYK